MKLFKYILLFTLFYSLVYCQKEDKNFDKLYSEGNISLNQGKYDEAITIFEKLLPQNSNKENTLYSIALCYHYKGDYNQAINFFTKSISENNLLFGSYYGRASSYRMIAENDKAEIDYKKLIELNPNFYLAYKNLGSIEFEKGNNELALSYYEKAIKYASPNKYDFLYLSKAIVEKKMGKYQEANEDLYTVLNLNPKHKMAYVDLGYNYIELKDYKNAILNFNKYLEFKKIPQYFVEKAFCEMKLGMNKEACEDLTNAKNLGFSEANEYIKRYCNK